MSRKSFHKTRLVIILPSSDCRNSVEHPCVILEIGCPQALNGTMMQCSTEFHRTVKHFVP